jgi:NADH-quinone oxidoreductase chain I
MLGNLKGLGVTIRTLFRKPVTYQYPEEPKPIEERYMGFPVLTWDEKVGEPYCTGCMVCVRYCPTNCMSAVMKDNPLHPEGKSTRRKIVDTFEINLARCIVCGICVDVCNFDAIEMSHEHELSKYVRNGNRADLGQLLEMGKEYQQEVSWVSKKDKKSEEES